MNAKLNRLMKDESGITALETAIILIAFVVVAAIFAFTVLSTGTFLTERSKEAAYAGLQEVRGSVTLKGGVVAHSTVANQADYVYFTLATVSDGSDADLSTGTNAVVKISYRDTLTNQNLTATDDGGNKPFTAVPGAWIVDTCTNCQPAPDTGGNACNTTAYNAGVGANRCILVPGAFARIIAYIPATLSDGVTAHTLNNNDTFAIEVKPPTGGTLLIERTLPAQLDTMTDLH